MKRKYLLSIFILLILINSINISNADTVYGPRPAIDKPILQVFKYASEKQIQIGTSITVFVNITNISTTQAAYNLSISEPIFNNWGISNFKGYERYVYLEINSSSFISYNYTLTLKKIGKFTIQPTAVSYYDENNSLYHAASSYIDLTVQAVKVVTDNSIVWKNLFWLSSIFVAFPILLYYFNKFIWKRGN